MSTSPLGGLFGPGSTARQFLMWGVVMQITGAVLAPVVQQITDDIFQVLPSTPISPAQAADLVLKGWWNMDAGAAEALRAGIDRDRFEQMVNDTGEPLGLQDLLTAYRRGFLQWDSGDTGTVSVLSGIKQSRIRDEWADTINKLRLQPIPTAEAVAATVRHQITPELGAQIAYYNGISGEDFTTLVNTYGSPPGPSELIELQRRGIIPTDGTGPDVLSLQQGIAEGDTKDKWFPAYVQLLAYHPPPRTITALERAGTISQQQALQLYAQSGLSPELAAAYSNDASATHTAKTKELAEGQVLELYRAKVLSNAEAGVLLGDLGYTSQSVTWVLEWEDMRRELAALQTATSRIHTLYVARKIGSTTATNALNELGLPADAVTELLRTWQLERGATVKVLTAAEIADALYYQVVTQDVAMAAMQDLGYSAWDAWLMLSIRNHSALPDQPAPDTSQTGQLP